MKETQEIDISQIIGMIVAIVAIVYAIGATIYDLFFRKKLKPIEFEEVEKSEKSERDMLEEFFHKLGREQNSDEDENEEELEQEKLHYVKKQKYESHAKRGELAVSAHREKKEWVRPEEKFVFHTNIEDRRSKTVIEDRKLDVRLRSGEELVNPTLKALATTDAVAGIKKVESPIRKLIQKFPSKQSMIIATEIISPPVGLRKW